VVEVRVLLGSAWLPILEMVLRMLEVVGSRWVTPTDRAFLEVALQDVASTEGVFTQVARVRSLAGVCKTLALD
jgi:hypothetical protein